MAKARRLQVRIAEDQHEFLRAYAERHNLSISLMVRDFIEWLKRREAQSGSTASS
jgi:hypothetical protein